MHEQFVDSIKSVQMKITGYIGGITTAKEQISHILGCSDHSAEYLEIDEKGRIVLQTPVCPSCGSNHYSLNGPNPKTLDNNAVIQVQRYLCLVCRKSYSPRIKGYARTDHYSLNLKSACLGMRVKNISLRLISQIYRTLTSSSPSHEIIRQWTLDHHSDAQNSVSKNCSGVYSYDEQHVKIGGKQFYRLLLIDALQGDVLADVVSSGCGKEVVEEFLLAALEEQPTAAFVSDGKPFYKNLFQQVGKKLKLKEAVIHQLCVFHALKNFSQAAFEVAKLEKKAGEKWKFKKDRKTLRNLLNLVFSVDDPQKAMKYVNRFSGNLKLKCESILLCKEISAFEKATELFRWVKWFVVGHHKVIEDQIKWISDNWRNLTHFLRNTNIPKTNNAAEHYFSKTLPKQHKKKYRNAEAFQGHLWCVQAHHNNALSLKT